MTTPTVEIPIPPVPSAQTLDNKGTIISQPWQQWFVNLRDKVNQINGVVIAISGSGTTLGAFNTLSPLTTAGDMLIYGSGNNTRLPIGSTGQILAVVSGMPAWVNPSAGSTPLTTKGDIYGYNTAPARIPVGTDSYVLTADSTNALGVSWKPAGTPTLPVTTKGDLLGFDTSANRIPVGTNGYILTADSTQALGVGWKPAPSSSPLTTKGDLYGFNTTNARVPVGTNGQVLTSDSTNTNGVSWQTPNGAVLNPSLISGLLHWWNPTASSFTHGGSQVTVNGNPVDTWVDQVSSGGINFTQVTSANQPTLYTSGAGGYSGLLFNGTSQFMSTTPISLTGFTVYVVVAGVSGASSGMVLEQSVNSNTHDGFYIFIPNNATVSYRRSVVDNYDFPTSWSNGGIYNHIILNLGGISRKNYPMLDGLIQSTSGGTTSNLTVTTATDNLYLMSRAGTASYLNGIVMEIVIFNRCLSLGERIGLLSYGQNKYGV